MDSEALPTLESVQINHASMPKPAIRRAWKRKKKDANGNFIEPATPKQAKEIVKVLAAEATAAIVSGKDLNTKAKDHCSRMSAQMRAHILSYLGENPEEARVEFANELLANARKCAQKLMERFDELPPNVQSFLFTAFTDKSEALRNKTAASQAAASVAVQINNFGDGTVNRDEIIAKLTGAAFKPATPVNAVPVEATPIPSASTPAS